MICESCVYYDPADRHCFPYESETVSWCYGFDPVETDFGFHWVSVSRSKKKDLINNELLSSVSRSS